MLPERLHWIIEAFEPEGDPDLLLRIARDLEAEGNLHGAAAVYDRAYGVEPTADRVRQPRAALLDRLSDWRERFGEAFTATVALSDSSVVASDRERWPALCFAEGMVHDVVGCSLEEGGADTMAFLAGPPAMVDATMRVMMLKGRLPPARIRFDRFS